MDDSAGGLDVDGADRGDGPVGSRLNRRDLDERAGRPTRPPAMAHYRRRRMTNLYGRNGYSDPRATARAGSELHSDHDPGNNAAWCPSVASAASVMAAVTPEPQ